MATPRADLEKMTTPKLREWVQEKFPSVVSVSGMKKEELIAAVIAEEVALGLRPKEQKSQATASMGKEQLKASIARLKQAKGAALAGKDGTLLRRTRLEIKRMKRRLRSLGEAS
jgi:hypothetical protein